MKFVKNNPYKFVLIGFLVLVFICTSVFFIAKNKKPRKEQEALLSRVDYRIFACGEEILLKVDKEAIKFKKNGLFARSKSGEVIADGLILNDENISLNSFFELFSGTIEYPDNHEAKLRIPTETGVREFQSGDLCKGKKADLYVINHRVETGTTPWSIYSRIIWKYWDYTLMNNYGKVPPGDCLIFLFDSEDVLDRPWPTCPSHDRALANGELILEK
jgi:hypothetical protein